jgi:thiamine pyrophosphokinase
MARCAVIFVNGFLPDIESVRQLIRPGDMLLAADGGTRHALALGLTPSVVIGDLDSLTADERRRVEDAGGRLVQHPRDKNETDLELALHHAVETGHREILLVGALGGRLDQTLGNLSLLTGAEFAGIDIRLDDGVEEVRFVRSGAEVRGAAGDLVSLLPWGCKVTGVTTAGLRWPLCGETLFPDKTRGISNEMLGDVASVSIESGLLLVIHRRAKSQSLTANR